MHLVITTLIQDLRFTAPLHLQEPFPMTTQKQYKDASYPCTLNTPWRSMNSANHPKSPMAYLDTINSGTIIDFIDIDIPFSHD